MSLKIVFQQKKNNLGRIKIIPTGYREKQLHDINYDTGNICCNSKINGKNLVLRIISQL